MKTLRSIAFNQIIKLTKCSLWVGGWCRSKKNKTTGTNMSTIAYLQPLLFVHTIFPGKNSLTGIILKLFSNKNWFNDTTFNLFVMRDFQEVVVQKQRRVGVMRSITPFSYLPRSNFRSSFICLNLKENVLN